MKIFGKEKLIEDLHKTTLLGFTDYYPYKDSKIYLKTFFKEELVPTSHYALESQLSKLIQIKKDLKEKDVDIFKLDGYVSFQDDIAITPPIIEVVNSKYLLIDGMHRVLLSEMYNSNIQCVVIEGAEPVTYAVPNKKGWDDVKVFKDKVPEGFKTRNHRYGDNYKDFSRVYNFEGKIFFKREHQKLYNILKDNSR